jgi:hypothetical protein
MLAITMLASSVHDPVAAAKPLPPVSYRANPPDIDWLAASVASVASSSFQSVVLIPSAGG